MMTQVLVTGIDGNEIRCSDGVTRNAIGNSRVCVGDVLWSNGDCVFSPGQPAVRAPIVWAEEGFRFADGNSTKMYHVDPKIKSVKKTADIKPPPDQAGQYSCLLLHCYSGRNEYFVWLRESGAVFWTCLIQKNGKVIAVFSTDFAAFSFPTACDAYIDANGDLIWGAAEWVNDYISIATYKNAEKTKTFLFDEAATEALFAERIRQRARAIGFSVNISGLETVRTATNVWSTIPRNGMIYDVSYIGCEAKEELTDGSAYLSSEPVFDLFNADALIAVSSSGSTIIRAKREGQMRSKTDGISIVDTESEILLLGGLLFNTAIFRASNNAIFAEVQQQSGDVETTFETFFPTRVYATEEYSDTPELIVCVVSSDTQSAGGVKVTIGDFLSVQPMMDVMNNNLFPVTGYSGANAGVVRSCLLGVVNSNQGKYHFYVQGVWPAVPVQGETFAFYAYAGVQTDDTTQGTLTINSNYPSIEDVSGDPGIVTDIGNGYSTAKKPKIESVQGWVSVSGALRHEGELVHADRLPLDGAWKTSPGAAIGLVNNTEGGKVLLVKKQAGETAQTVVETVPPFNPGSIITKRFT